MDEIDAALDFKNVSIVANYIKVVDTHIDIDIDIDMRPCIPVAITRPRRSINLLSDPCSPRSFRLVQERTKNAQFVIISLRNNMFELADRLVGIYKTFDATKSVTINPKVFVAAAAGQAAPAAPAAAGKDAAAKATKTSKKAAALAAGPSTIVA